MDNASDTALSALGKFLLAVCLTALTTTMIYLVMAAFDVSGPPSLPIYFWLTLLQSFVVIAAFALLLAVPITMALARSGRETLATYLIAGALAGTIMFEVMHILLSSDITLRQHLAPRALLYSAGTGGVPGALFGIFWWQFGRKPLLKREIDG